MSYLGAVARRLKLTMRHSCTSGNAQNTRNIARYINEAGFQGQGDSDLDSDDGVLLVEQVPDDVIIVAETALQHHPSALVTPRIP
jgi:hypothetical protein